MKSEKIREHTDVLREIAKASDVIRRKYKIIRKSKDTSEQVMEEMFKPLSTPLQELVDTSKKQIKQEIKTEPQDISVKNESISMKNEEPVETADDMGDDDAFFDIENDADKTIVAHDTPTTSTPITKQKKEDSVWQYLKMFGTEQEVDLDQKYGVRKLLQGLKIGNSKISFDTDQVHVVGKKYKATPGLLELLFKKSPDTSILKSTDKQNYAEIALATNVHRSGYNADKSIRRDVKSAKYNTFIAQHAESPRKRGGGLPKHKIARKAGQTVDYVHWNDPNEIVDRLRLLIASQAAGNTSHSNEIVSIIEELREAKIIY